MTAKQIEKELQKISIEFEERCKNGMTGNADRITLEEYSKIYLEAKIKTLSPSTFEFYERAIKNKILPALGFHKVNQIKPPHIDVYKRQQTD